MDIKSNMIGVKSSHGGANRSHVGGSQSIAHQDTPVHHPVAPRGNPGKIAIKPEIDYGYRNATAKTNGNNGVAPGSFKASNARTTERVIHPNPKHDPACVKC